MGLKAGWIALFLFVWIIGAFLGSTFEYHSTAAEAGVSYTTGTATFETGNSTVTGQGTAWNAGMENGLIMMNNDALWHKISTVGGAVTLTLYGGYSGAGGAIQNYTMATSPGWAGTGSGGYGQSPTTTMEYLTNVSNAVQRIPILGAIPLPIPNGEYFSTAFKVLTWQWSFMAGYGMFYWIVCAPFVVMGVLSMIMLIYGVIAGNFIL